MSLVVRTSPELLCSTCRAQLRVDRRDFGIIHPIAECERRTVRIERRPASQEGDDENAQRPDVGGETVRISTGYFSTRAEGR